MYLINTGNIHVSKNITEVAKILVEEGIYSSLDMVPVYDEQTIDIEDVYGDIESELDRVVDRCNALLNWKKSRKSIEKRPYYQRCLCFDSFERTRKARRLPYECDI